jgi:hypothetical protein
MIDLIIAWFLSLINAGAVNTEDLAPVGFRPRPGHARFDVADIEAMRNSVRRAAAIAALHHLALHLDGIPGDVGRQNSPPASAPPAHRSSGQPVPQEDLQLRVR